MDELYNKVKYNESIAGIMIINPDNPTGAVFPPDVIAEMIDIARKFDLFIVADEIYANLVYNNADYQPISSLIRDVPAISLQGISKEMPWPGARCGWMEVYNQKGHTMFQRYVKSILDAKMLEVCSTTLPQSVIPKIYSHPEWKSWQTHRRAFFEKRSRMVSEIFQSCPGVIVNPPSGAFYLSVVFKDKLSKEMNLRITNPQLQAFMKEIDAVEMEADRKFVYQLLASQNICVVPLSSFVTDLQGFRCTLLEQDDDRFRHIYSTIARAVTEFIDSATPARL